MSKKIKPIVSEGFAPWHVVDAPHKLKKTNGVRSIRVLFVDGCETRASASQVPGKPFDVARAVRVACTMYRHQQHRAAGGWQGDSWVEHIPVAEIWEVECMTTGDRWDPVVANALTESFRAAGETRAERRARNLANSWREIWERQPEREERPAGAPPIPSMAVQAIMRDWEEPKGVDLPSLGVDVAPSPADLGLSGVLEAMAGRYAAERDSFLALVRRQRDAVAALAPQSLVMAPAPVAPVQRAPVPVARRLSARELRARVGSLPAWGSNVVSFPVNVGV